MNPWVVFSHPAFISQVWDLVFQKNWVWNYVVALPKAIVEWSLQGFKRLWHWGNKLFALPVPPTTSHLSKVPHPGYCVALLALSR